MIAGLPFLPPVIDQTISRVPLSPLSALGFALIAFVALYLAFRRSPWIAAALAFAVPFAAYRDIGHTTITIEKCIAFGAAAGLLLGGAPLWVRSLGARRIFYVGTAVLATIALSSLNATYHGNVAREFLKQAEYLVLLWCAATFTERIARSQVYFIGGVVASTLIVSTLAVSQAVIGGAPSGVWVNGHPLPRVAGPLEGPNQLSGFLEAALPVAWVMPMLTAAFGPLRNYVVGASSAALVLAQSRAGLIVAALSYAVLWRMRKATARASAWSAAVGTAFGLIVSAAWFVFWAHASQDGIQRLFGLQMSEPAGGVGTRYQLWPAALQLFQRHPLFGVGAGNFELLLPTVGLHGIQTHAGSLWLQTLAEQGIVGLLALVAFAFVVLRETFRVRNNALGLAAFLAIASLLTHQIVDDLFFFPKVAALCWLLLGAGTANERTIAPMVRPNGQPANVADAADEVGAPVPHAAPGATPLTG